MSSVLTTQMTGNDELSSLIIISQTFRLQLDSFSIAVTHMVRDRMIWEIKSLQIWLKQVVLLLMYLVVYYLNKVWKLQTQQNVLEFLSSTNYTNS